MRPPRSAGPIIVTAEPTNQGRLPPERRGHGPGVGLRGVLSAARGVTDGLFEGGGRPACDREIVAPLSLRVDESSPWVDARLSDGSRVQTQFLSAPFLPNQGPPDAASCLVRRARSRRCLPQGHFERRSCNLVSSLAGPSAELLRWAADSQQICLSRRREALMRWIRDPYRRPWWSRQRWDRERWLNVLFFAYVAALVAGMLVFVASQPAWRTFAGNGGIGWGDRVGVMPGRAAPESPEELAGPSDPVAAVAQLLEPDAVPQAFTGQYETFLAAVIGTEPTSGAGKEGSEAPPAPVPQPTPPVPSPTTTAFPPATTPTTATDSPEPPASETSSPSPNDSPTESPPPSDSPTESPPPSDSPTESPPPSDSPTESP
jgi:hypothetical protein